MQVYHVIFFTRAGIPLLKFDFETGKFTVDEALIGGFLSAITGFSNEIFQVTSDIFVIDNGTYKLTILLNQELVFTVISDSPLLHLAPSLRKVIDYFQKFLFVSSNQQYDPERLDSLKIKIIKVLFYHPINEEWRAIIDYEHENYDHVVKKFPRLKEFQSDIKIGFHSFYKKAFADDIFEMLNYAYYEKVCRFEGIFEPADYIQPLDSFKSLLDPIVIRNSTLLRKIPIADINKIVLTISGIMKISDCRRQLGENIIDILQLLHNLHFIEIIESKYRQIYLLIDIINTIFDELYAIDDSEKYNLIIQNFIFEKHLGDLLGIFQLIKDKASISRDNLNIKEKNDTELEDYKNDVKKMIINLIEYLTKTIGKPAKKIINTLFDRIEINKADVPLFDNFKDVTNIFCK